MSLSRPDTQRWLAGQQPAGAVYIAGDQVDIRHHAISRRSGTVLMLAELDPEPRYLVAVGPGRYMQVPQSDLQHRHNG